MLPRFIHDQADAITIRRRAMRIGLRQCLRDARIDADKDILDAAVERIFGFVEREIGRNRQRIDPFAGVFETEHHVRCVGIGILRCGNAHERLWPVLIHGCPDLHDLGQPLGIATQQRFIIVFRRQAALDPLALGTLELPVENRIPDFVPQLDMRNQLGIEIGVDIIGKAPLILIIGVIGQCEPRADLRLVCQRNQILDGHAIVGFLTGIGHLLARPPRQHRCRRLIHHSEIAHHLEPADRFDKRRIEADFLIHRRFAAIDIADRIGRIDVGYLQIDVVDRLAVIGGWPRLPAKTDIVAARGLLGHAAMPDGGDVALAGVAADDFRKAVGKVRMVHRAKGNRPRRHRTHPAIAIDQFGRHGLPPLSLQCHLPAVAEDQIGVNPVVVPPRRAADIDAERERRARRGLCRIARLRLRSARTAGDSPEHGECGQ